MLKLNNSFRVIVGEVSVKQNCSFVFFFPSPKIQEKGAYNKENNSNMQSWDITESWPLRMDMNWYMKFYWSPPWTKAAHDESYWEDTGTFFMLAGYLLKIQQNASGDKEPEMTVISQQWMWEPKTNKTSNKSKSKIWWIKIFLLVL